MLQARYMVEKPDEMVFTMKITMSAKEWESLRDNLETARDRGQFGNEGHRLSQMITSLLADARKTFWTDENSYAEF